MTREEGILVSRLKPGTRLVVDTKNSVYDITVVSHNQVWVRGGRTFPEYTLAYFQGSNFGGTTLKLHWIGYGMYMEFIDGKRHITTSKVKAAAVFGDNWCYDMEWSE